MSGEWDVSHHRGTCARICPCRPPPCRRRRLRLRLRLLLLRRRRRLLPLRRPSPGSALRNKRVGVHLHGLRACTHTRIRSHGCIYMCECASKLFARVHTHRDQPACARVFARARMYALVCARAHACACARARSRLASSRSCGFSALVPARERRAIGVSERERIAIGARERERIAIGASKRADSDRCKQERAESDRCQRESGER